MKIKTRKNAYQLAEWLSTGGYVVWIERRQGYYLLVIEGGF